MRPSTHHFPSGWERHNSDSVPATEPLSTQDMAGSDSHNPSDRSALLDMAYEEFCQAVDRGESIDKDQFAARYPDIEPSLLELLQVHSFVVGNSLLTDVEPDIHWPTSGESFLGFELLEEIGKGAFSRVFLARERGLGNREVVVKVSQKGTTEASMLGRLDHPHIIPIHSLTSDPAVNLSALCMPFLGRSTAAEWIQTRFKAANSRRVKSERHLQSVIDIGKGVCLGLQFAHARQILHCDIKPSNILITHDGEPVILDFNLSTAPSQDLRLLGGTLMYMAPEQILRAQGDPSAKITESTDVFCLGATLYQMATGLLPFPVPTASSPRLKDVMEAALKVRYAFADRSPNLPDPFFSALRDALAFDPQDRISSVVEFHNRLAACQKHRLQPRQRRAKILTVFGVSVLCLTAAYFISENSKASESPDRKALTEVHQETPIRPEPIVEIDPLQLAQIAEAEARYAEAIERYQAILKEEIEIPNLEELRATLTHSLAFCQMMDGQYVKANMTFAELPSPGINDDVVSLNKTACMFLLSLSSSGEVSEQLFRSTKIALRNLIEFNDESVEHHHALAITEAYVSRFEVGVHRESAITGALFWAKRALRFNLSKQKAMVVGHLLPVARSRDPLDAILQENPTIEPDLTVLLPVQSPASGKTMMAKAVIP